MNNTSSAHWGRVSVYLLSAILIAFGGILIYLISPYEFGMTTTDSVKKVYFADHISDLYKEIIDEFNEAHEGRIEVVPVDLPFEKFTTNERKEILSRFLRGNDVIDIFVVDQIWVPRFAKWGAEIDDIFGEFVEDSLLSFSHPTAYFNNKLVSIPIHIDVSLLYYRKDLISNYSGAHSFESKLKESVTWVQFWYMKNKFPAENPFYVFQGDAYEGLVCKYFEQLSDNRWQYPDQYDYSETNLSNSLLLLNDIYEKSNSDYNILPELRENSSYKYFLENDGVFLRGWPSTISDMKHLGLDNKKIDKLEIAALPHHKGRGKHFTLGGWNIMISKFTTKKYEAAEFIKFFMNSINQEKIYRRRSHLPTNINVYRRLKGSKADSNLTYIHSLLKNGIYRPFSTDYTRLSDFLAEHLNNVLKGKQNVKKSAELVSEEINNTNGLRR